MAIARKLLLPLAFAAASLGAASPGFDENRELVLYADFDGGPSPTVAREGAKLLKAENLQTVPGRSGQAFYFTEQQGGKASELTYAPGIPLHSGSDWTIAMYVKPDAAGNAVSNGKGRSRTLLRTYASGGWGDGDITAGFIPWGRFDVSRFGADKKKPATSGIYGNLFPANTWTHVAIANRGGEITVYVNGVAAKNTRAEKVEEAGPVQRGIRIGCSYAAGKSWFDGAVDEFKLFRRALDANEIRLIMDTRPDGRAPDADTQPALQIPFNGRVDASSPRGGVTIRSERVIFKASVIGMGAEFSRHRYDACSLLTVETAGGLNGPAMTVGFFFTPKNAPASDPAERGLLASAAGKNAWKLTRSGGTLQFTVENGGKSESVSADISGLAAGTPVHIAAGYGGGKLFLALDGKEVASAPLTVGTGRDGDASKLRVGDLPQAGQYDPTQAEGVIDELRIFAARLAPERLAAEVARKDDPAAQQASDSNRSPVEFRPVSDAERKLWGREGEFRRENNSRTTIWLNGLWRFQPVPDGTTPNAADWWYLAVPGRYAGHENGRTDAEFRMRKPDFSISEEYSWKGTPTWKISTALFERTFDLDPAWKGRRLRLVFEELSNSSTGRVWLNGKFLGALNGEVRNFVELDPAQLRFGEPNRLLLEVVDADQRWNWRGVKGDVKLEVLPDVQLGDPRIVTDLSGGKLAITVDAVNRGTTPRKFRLQAAIAGKNAPAKLTGETVEAAPGQTVRLELVQPWRNPVLWDFETPYLYSCELQLVDEAGREIDRIDPVRFGFREFRVDGREYKLNGKTIHIRNHDEWTNTTNDYQWCLQFVKLLKSLGYNAIRGPFRAKDYNLDNMVRACDEGGVLLFLNAFGVGQGEYSGWDSDEVRSAMARRMEDRVGRYRNSPSVVMWYLSVNFLGYAWDYHPLKMADGYQPPFKLDRFKICEEGAKVLRELDPTRPFFYQAGGNFGPIINSNAYFCWLPEAEKLAWVEPWRQMGVKPLHVIETSFPYSSSFFGMDLQNPGEKPLFVYENAARYFGDAAYAMSDDTLNRIYDYCRTGSGQNNWEFLGAYRNFDVIGALKCRMLTPSIKAWRSSGISGVCPFAEVNYAFRRKSPSKSIHDAWSQKVDPGDFRTPGWHPDVVKYAAHQDIDPEQPLPLAAALREALDPELIQILGPAEAPSSRAGNYVSGAKIEREAVAINDTLQSKRFRIEFRLSGRSGNRSVGRFDRELAPGEAVRVPLSFQAPEVTGDEPESFRLEALLGIPGVVKSTAELLIFPTAAPVPADATACYGDRSRLPLPEANSFADAAKLTSLDGIRTLIVAPKALNAEFSAWAAKVGLAGWVARGNRVVVLEQTPEALRGIGLTAPPVYLREAFLSRISGLPDAAFRHWQGVSTLAPHHPAPPAGSEESIPEQLWHYTAQDMLSAYPIRRPAGGAVRPLLVGGKDLIYAPVLNFRVGRGSVIFSQLEVGGRSGEPAAGETIRRLLAASPMPGAELPGRPLYALSPEKNPLAPELGFRTAPLPEQLPDNALLLIDRPLTGAERTRILQAVQAGASALFLAADQPLLDQLKLSTKPVEFHSLTLQGDAARQLFDFPARRDLFWRYKSVARAVSGPGVTPLTAPGAFSMLPLGKGKIFFALFDRSEGDKKLAQTLKVNQNSSLYWAESINADRLTQLTARLLAGLGAEPEFNPAVKLEHPDVEAARLNLDGEWFFRFDPENTGSAAFPKLREFPAAQWTRLKVPGYWENQSIASKFLPKGCPSAKSYNGFAWYARTVELPESLRNRDLILEIGTIDDLDITYVNGEEVGRTGEDTPGYWMAVRRYPVPARMTRSGRLTILVNVNDLRGNGGISGHAALVEKIDDTGERSTPYGQRTPPLYNTERAIRW